MAIIKKTKPINVDEDGGAGKNRYSLLVGM
jgi:hypothetical protein